MIKLVCALGNPGREYEKTRHNAGWLVLDSIRLPLEFEEKFKGRYARYFSPSGVKILFLKPRTFMNKSGESLRSCMDFFSIKLDEIVVIHDDLELEFGRIEMKNGGGLGGHNGLKSIEQHLGSRDFARLRFGIGRPAHGSVSSFVLSRFSKDEEIILSEYLNNAGALLKTQLGL